MQLRTSVVLLSWSLVALAPSCRLVLDGEFTTQDGGSGVPDADSDGATDAGTDGMTPPVMGPVTIAAGRDHTCALFGEGTVWCWGSNNFGQLGTGTPGGNAKSTTPVKVPGIDDAVAIAAGPLYTCVARRDGSAWCWGQNGTGQLGTGMMSTFELTPMKVNTTSVVVDVSAGGGTSCALLQSGTVECWGQNSSGQVGDGSNTLRLLPVPVAGNLQGVQDLASGDLHVCALRNDGSVSCWGENLHGALGNGSMTSSNLPVASNLTSGATATALLAGALHTCAILSGGQVSCWGHNLKGQLGQPVATEQLLVPTTVPGVTNARDGDGYLHTCVRLQDSTISCWGDNSGGQLGESTSASPRSTPKAIMNVNTATMVAAGIKHACTLLANREIACWGDNLLGQLGDGTVAPSITPVKVMFPPAAL